MTLIRRLTTALRGLRRLPHAYGRLESVSGVVDTLERRVQLMQEALGRIEERQLAQGNQDNLVANEFRAFSQWGEDGIIQFLLRHVNIERKTFVEFGADNYNVESNTRFLLTNNNWTGLVIDSSPAAIKRLTNSYPYVLYDLRAVAAFITRDNINALLSENGISGEIGLLSIDIDGNDYWLWMAINVIHPVIVIIEYNYRFGSDRAVTIPYDEQFARSKAHPSRLYFGASLKALCVLAHQKGYAFVGCNSNGVNAFFVRLDKKPDFLKALSAEEGYLPGAFGEMFEMNGELVKLSPAEEQRYLRSLGLPLISVEEPAQ